MVVGISDQISGTQRIEVKRLLGSSNETLEMSFGDDRVLMVKRGKHDWTRRMFRTAAAASELLRNVTEGSKLDGIAWSEHIVQGRPFVWLEDDNTGAEHRLFLHQHGFGDSFRHCDVTRDPNALVLSFVRLKERHDR